jgi:hypothetical protein
MSRAFTSLPPPSPPPTSNGARAHSTVVSNGAASPSLSSALPPPQAHAPQAPANAAASARAAPVAGIFDRVPSIPCDLVDLLTHIGTFAFLQDLHKTGRLWDLRNFCISLLVPCGDARISGMASKLSSPLPSATPHNPSPYISSGPLPNSFPPFLCPARDVASLGMSRSMHVAFRKGSGVPLESDTETQQPLDGP